MLTSIPQPLPWPWHGCGSLTQRETGRQKTGKAQGPSKAVHGPTAWVRHGPYTKTPDEVEWRGSNGAGLSKRHSGSVGSSPEKAVASTIKKKFRDCLGREVQLSVENIQCQTVGQTTRAGGRGRCVRWEWRRDQGRENASLLAEGTGEVSGN